MRRCDGIDRRELLRVGGLSALGIGLSTAFQLRSASGAPTNSRELKNCILIWLDGGPSHIDTFDPKPGAPAEIRGNYKPISTNVPGIEISEKFSHLSKLADKYCLIRSVTSELGVHGLGSHYLLSGYKPSPALQYPSYGSVHAHCQTKESVLPSYVVMRGERLQAGNTLYNGYLPGASRPFVLEADPSRPEFRVRDLSRPGSISIDSLHRRREFVEDLDKLSRQIEENGAATGRQAHFEQAYRLILSNEAKAAFDLSKEKTSIRDNYGRRYNRRTRVGQSCLLARRLIEAGCRFVTVTDSGWDMHGGIFNSLDNKLPALDSAVSTLLTELDERGLLQDTLILVMGEFGRTPRLNADSGRDHWPRAFSVLLAGADVKAGQVVGQSDPRGYSPSDRPVSPTDLARTIYELLCINPNRKFHTADGRPVLVSPGGQIIDECIA